MKRTEAAPADEKDVAKYRADAVLLLQSVRSSLADLLAQVMEGETGALKDLVAKQAELESALKRVFEAESRYEDWIRRERSEDAGEIDLDAIRAEIGCRLHRLRTCGEGE